MGRTSLSEMKRRRVDAMTTDEREAFDDAYAVSKLAIEVGEIVRAARREASLTQRELARRTGTSQAAIARLEAGGVAATLTTLQRLATALGLEVVVELRHAS